MHFGQSRSPKLGLLRSAEEGRRGKINSTAAKRMSIHLITGKQLPLCRLLLSCFSASTETPRDLKGEHTEGLHTISSNSPLAKWPPSHAKCGSAASEMSITQAKGILGNTMPVIYPFCSTWTDTAMVVNPLNTTRRKHFLYCYFWWCNANRAAKRKYRVLQTHKIKNIQVHVLWKSHTCCFCFGLESRQNI